MATGIRFFTPSGSSEPPTVAPGRGALIFLAIFALPFAAGGIWALTRAVTLWSTEGGTESAWAATIVGLVFVVAGFGIWMLLPWMRRRQLAEYEHKRMHPDSPWLWRPEWAAGRIPCESGKAVIGVWLFALFWNAISAPILWNLPREVSGGNQAALIALLFPAVGIGLVVWAVRTTLRWRRFGRSVFELSSLPGVIGGHLTGTVQLASEVRPEAGFEARLSCIEVRVSGSGKNRSRHEDIRWEETRRIGLTEMHAGRFGTALPIRFTIPYRLDPSSENDGRRWVEWRMELAAELPGIDYHAQFEVPVYRTPGSSSDVTDVDVAAEAGAGSMPARPTAEGGSFSAESRIRVSREPDGRSLFHFPAARNVGAALGLSVVAVIWTGIVWLLTTLEGAGWLMAVFFGLFDVLILWGALRYWFRVTRVFAGSAGLEIRTRTLIAASTKQIPAESIHTLVAEVSGQANSKPFYQLHVRGAQGEKRGVAGDMMRDKREAEWLAISMWRALGRSDVPPPPDD